MSTSALSLLPWTFVFWFINSEHCLGRGCGTTGMLCRWCTIRWVHELQVCVSVSPAFLVCNVTVIGVRVKLNRWPLTVVWPVDRVVDLNKKNGQIWDVHILTDRFLPRFYIATEFVRNYLIWFGEVSDQLHFMIPVDLHAFFLIEPLTQKSGFLPSSFLASLMIERAILLPPGMSVLLRKI